jgi:S1-C subfamily serine protease
MAPSLRKACLSAVVILLIATWWASGYQQPPSRVYEKAVQSVVFIDSAGSGTGFIFRSQGCILTAAHVIGHSGQEKINVRFQDGSEAAAELLSFDNKNDIAVLKVDLDSLPWVPLGNSDQAGITDQVMTISYPGKLASDVPTVSVGHIEAIRDVELPLYPGIISTLKDIFQIDGTIRPGSSGGPVFNAEGEVIALVSGTPSTTGLKIAYVTPINRAPIPVICQSEGGAYSPFSVDVYVIVFAVASILLFGAIWYTTSRRSANPTKLLQASEFFSSLDKAELDQVKNACTVRAFDTGDALIQEGDMDSARMFVILKGQVEVRRGESSLGKRGVGRAIGELSLFTGDPRTADVIALKPTVGLELSRTNLISLIRKNPEIGVKMFDDMLFRLQEAADAREKSG